MKFKAVTYDVKYQAAYIELNREWIEKHFRLEPMDIEQLENPQKIIEQGGEIFFIVDQDTKEAVGVCAMVPHGASSYELAKMAVSPLVRGQGAGDMLMKVAIAWAKSKKATDIMLLSNTVLQPAIALYKKYGFETVHLGPHPDYERANIEMKLPLTGA